MQLIPRSHHVIMLRSVPKNTVGQREHLTLCHCKLFWFSGNNRSVLAKRRGCEKKSMKVVGMFYSASFQEL